MQKITPNLWFDGKAKEAAEFYTSVLPDSEVSNISYYPDSAEEGLADFQLDMAGKELTVDFTLGDLNFTAINAGAEFRFSPSTSFMVNFDPARDGRARERMDEVWERLIDGGQALMPLQAYDFSEHFGWVRDRYGLSWQLILTDPEGDPRPFVIPALMFGGVAQNRAGEAIEFYTSTFPDSGRGGSCPFGQQTGPATADALMFADFVVADQWFVANDSAEEQDFTFNEAVSFAVACEDQEEIDYFWERLSTVPEAEQCGWCKDAFGVSWQVVPAHLNDLMNKPGAYATMMRQKKIVIAEY